jgi:ArsR family transcriptional regulator
MYEYNQEQAEVLRVLGHPARLAIVKGLLKRACNVSKIVSSLGVPQPTVSQHLRALKAAGIVRGERKGVEICYRVVNDFVRKMFQRM